MVTVSPFSTALISSGSLFLASATLTFISLDDSYLTWLCQLGSRLWRHRCSRLETSVGPSIRHSMQEPAIPQDSWGSCRATLRLPRGNRIGCQAGPSDATLGTVRSMRVTPIG